MGENATSGNTNSIIGYPNEETAGNTSKHVWGRKMRARSCITYLILLSVVPAALSLQRLAPPNTPGTTPAMRGNRVRSMSGRQCPAGGGTAADILAAHGQWHWLRLRGGGTRAVCVAEIAEVPFVSGTVVPATDLPAAAVLTVYHSPAPGRRLGGKGAVRGNVQSAAMKTSNRKTRDTMRKCSMRVRIQRKHMPAGNPASEPTAPSSSSAEADCGSASSSATQHTVNATQTHGGIQTAIISATQSCRAWVMLDPVPLCNLGTTRTTSRTRHTRTPTANSALPNKKKVGRPVGSSKRYTTQLEGARNDVPGGLSTYDSASGLQPLKCVSHEGCSKRANYGSPVEKLPLFCGPHRRTGDVDLRNRRCQVFV